MPTAKAAAALVARPSLSRSKRELDELLRLAMKSPTRRIALANQKGGPGKTTLCVHVSIALALLGLRVLVIDLDAQGNATQYLGVRKSEDLLPEVLRGQIGLLAAVEKSRYGVDVLPGGANLDLTLLVKEGPMAVLALKQRLDALHERHWDVILMDCPPNLATATSGALIAAHEVLIPIDEPMAVEGLFDLDRSIEQAKGVNPKLNVLGIVQTKTKENETITKQIAALLQKAYGDLVFPTMIPRATKLPQSYLSHEPLHSFDSKGKQSQVAIQSFDAVAREMLRRWRAKE
jgi:chromosome partitioning protein